MSPLTTFVKSLRMEGGVASSGASNEEVVDHFKDIPLDELPQGIREKVEAARNSFGTLQKTATEASEKLKASQEFAKTNQSRADKLEAIVRKHNLGDAPVAAPNTDEARILARAARFEKQGIKPDVALAYAKMHESEFQHDRQEILAGLNPLATNVGNLQANQVLSEVQGEHATFFAIPEIKTSVEQSVETLVKNGRAVNKETVETLLNMAYGKFAMANPEKLPKKGDDTIPNLSGKSMSGGGHVNNPGRKDGDAPRASQPETPHIMSAIDGFMKQGMPKKGAK